MVLGEAQMQCVTHPDSRPSATQCDRWSDNTDASFLRAFRKNRR